MVGYQKSHYSDDRAYRSALTPFIAVLSLLSPRRCCLHCTITTPTPRVLRSATDCFLKTQLFYKINELNTFNSFNHNYISISLNKNLTSGFIWIKFTISDCFVYIALLKNCFLKKQLINYINMLKIFYNFISINYISISIRLLKPY